jgi:nucleotide-binding universal stress UspA family protein
VVATHPHTHLVNAAQSEETAGRRELAGDEAIVAKVAQWALPTPRTTSADVGWQRPSGGSVVVGVDGSPSSYHAFEWAARHAWMLRTDLQVYSAIRGPDHVDLPIDETVQRVLHRLPMLTAHFRQSGEDPVSALSAAGRDAAALVLGSRGRAHAALGLGALVPQVIRRVPCDVVVVRGRPEAIRGEHGWITAAIGGHDALPVLANAIALCRARVARLRVLHIRPVRRGVDQVVEDDVVRHAAAVLRHAAPDVRADFVAEHRQPHEVLTGLPSDLIVLGRSRHGIDPMTKTALHHAPCPVLIGSRTWPDP